MSNKWMTKGLAFTHIFRDSPDVLAICNICPKNEARVTALLIDLVDSGSCSLMLFPFAEHQGVRFLP